jgi:hypothetical protein
MIRRKRNRGKVTMEEGRTVEKEPWKMNRGEETVGKEPWKMNRGNDPWK